MIAAPFSFCEKGGLIFSRYLAKVILILFIGGGVVDAQEGQANPKNGVILKILNSSSQQSDEVVGAQGSPSIIVVSNPDGSAATYVGGQRLSISAGTRLDLEALKSQAGGSSREVGVYSSKPRPTPTPTPPRPSGCGDLGCPSPDTPKPPEPKCHGPFCPGGTTFYRPAEQLIIYRNTFSAPFPRDLKGVNFDLGSVALQPEAK